MGQDLILAVEEKETRVTLMRLIKILDKTSFAHITKWGGTGEAWSPRRSTSIRESVWAELEREENPKWGLEFQGEVGTSF